MHSYRVKCTLWIFHRAYKQTYHQSNTWLHIHEQTCKRMHRQSHAHILKMKCRFCRECFLLCVHNLHNSLALFISWSASQELQSAKINTGKSQSLNLIITLNWGKKNTVDDDALINNQSGQCLSCTVFQSKLLGELIDVFVFYSYWSCGAAMSAFILPARWTEYTVVRSWGLQISRLAVSEIHSWTDRFVCQFWKKWLQYVSCGLGTRMQQIAGGGQEIAINLLGVVVCLWWGLYCG